MKKNIIVIALLLSAFNITNAQSPINLWNFWHYSAYSNSATIDFNSGSPQATNTGSINAGEGVSTICNPLGQVLFYSNGTEIWDASNSVMQNGSNLNGGSSSSQAVLIVPNPLNNGIYYVFTTGDGNQNQSYPTSNKELRWTEVNMTLNGGLGAVTANKSIVLQTGVGEKLTSARHKNNNDVWVLTHGNTNNSFYSFLVTASGVVSVPVVSSLGSSSSGSGYGNLKFSYNGCYIAHLERASAGFIEVFNFDGQNGSVTSLAASNYVNNPFHLEFSPDSKRIYASFKGFFAVSNKELWQYDLTNLSAFSTSKIQLNNGVDVTGLQMGADGKIYVATRSQGTIHSIENPNSLGVSCNFNLNSVNLNGKTSGTQFPQRIPGLESDFNYSLGNSGGTCLDDLINVSVFDTFPSPLDSVKWDFGDLTSGGSNFTSGSTSSHIYSQTGLYTVELVTYLGKWTDTTTYQVNVSCTPLSVDLLEFNASCENGLIELNWITAGETNNDLFTVERSSDGFGWEGFVTIVGRGSSSQFVSYSATDDEAIDGTSYYRLKQIDFNGRLTYSNIKSVGCGSFSDLMIYPNPFKNSFNIVLNKELSYPLHIELRDLFGRVVYQESIMKRSAQFYTVALENKLSNGSYIVKVYNENELFTTKLIKTN